MTTVRYFAAAQEASGVSEERVTLPDAATVGDLTDLLIARHGDGLATVLALCAVLVDGVLLRDRAAPLGSPTTVDVLPPFAGG